MTDVSTTEAGLKPTGRSAVTNGKHVVYGVDGRSERARRYKDLVDELAIAHGVVSEADMLLCREAARLQVEQEERTAAAIRGESVDHGAAVTAGNSLRRILKDLEARQRQRKRTQRLSGATA